MRRYLLACLIVAVAHPVFVLANGPKGAAKFVDRDGVELVKTEKLLKLDKDFTIEILAKWQPGTVYLAGDEAWPRMSERIDVAEATGWVLRTHCTGNQETLDFTVATKETQWARLTAQIPLKRPEWNHIAVCRKKDTLVLFFNGETISQLPLEGLTLIESPTPMYLGVRAHAYGDRRVNGFIAKFAVSQTFRFPQIFDPELTFMNDRQTLLLLSLDEQHRGVVNDMTGHGHLGLLRDAEIVLFD